MSNNNIFTKKLAGLDINVWRVLLLAIILPAGLLSYRLMAKESCIPVNFTIRALSADTGYVFETGETIFFKASTSEKEIIWNFGKTDEPRTGQYVFYIFQTAGDYFVSANTGAGCENLQKITIINPPVDSAIDRLKGNLIGPGITITDKSTSYKFSGEAKSYDWVVLNNPKFNQNGAEANFTFTEKGTYTIQLTLDNDRSKRLSKIIKVDRISTGIENFSEKPSDKQTTSSGCISTFISDAAFAKLMDKVIVGEVFVNSFDPYLSNRGNTPVIINKKKENKDFAWACEFLNGKRKSQNVLWKKKVEITGAKLTRDENKCVTLIEINYD